MSAPPAVVCSLRYLLGLPVGDETVAGILLLWSNAHLPRAAKMLKGAGHVSRPVSQAAPGAPERHSTPPQGEPEIQPEHLYFSGLRIIMACSGLYLHTTQITHKQIQ